MRAQDSESGLGELAGAAVIISVFAIVLVGMVVLAVREDTLRAAAVSGVGDQVAVDVSTPRASVPPTPTPRPDGPGEYTVQRGDSLFSVAAALGVSPNELIYWNREAYPTLQSTPALRPGWVLRTAGPPLPTPTPRPTPAPTPSPLLAAPDVPGLPVVTAASFPAADRVTVSWYAVTGATPRDIYDSIDANGPYSEWAGGSATAHVQVQPSFDFGFETGPDGECSVVPTGTPAISISYHVVLPGWSPPADVAPGTIEWWAEQLSGTVVHEAHHVTLYEERLGPMRDVVATGTCDSVPQDLQAIWDDALRANCEFDLVEYGYAAGLTLESCVLNGGS